MKFLGSAIGLFVGVGVFTGIRTLLMTFLAKGPDTPVGMSPGMITVCSAVFSFFIFGSIQQAFSAMAKKASGNQSSSGGTVVRKENGVDTKEEKQ